jgi:hypothetical protein
MGFGFDDKIYRNFIKLFTTFHKSSSTWHSRLLTTLQYCTTPESKSELLYDWRFTANKFVLSTGPLRPTTSNFIFKLNTCDYSPYATSSLTRGWDCRLRLLLSSPAQSFWGPSPAGLMTTFYRLRFETPPTWRTRSLYLYPSGTGWTNYTLRHWVSPLHYSKSKSKLL